MSDTFVQNESIETIIQRYKSTIYGGSVIYKQPGGCGRHLSGSFPHLL